MAGRKFEKPKTEQKVAPIQQKENKEEKVKEELSMEQKESPEIQAKEQSKEQEESPEIQEKEQSKEQEESTEMQTEEQPEQEEKPKKLYAIYPILFESHQYKVGEQLPTTDMEMVEAWIEAEAAIWK